MSQFRTKKEKNWEKMSSSLSCFRMMMLDLDHSCRVPSPALCPLVHELHQVRLRLDRLLQSGTAGLRGKPGIDFMNLRFGQKNFSGKFLSTNFGQSSTKNNGCKLSDYFRQYQEGIVKPLKAIITDLNMT
jgi:hypothetical protein